MPRMKQPRIIATLHEETALGIKVSRVELARAPVPIVPDLDSIMGGWWLCSGGYPVGELYGTVIDL